ncbi:aminoglycoside phosphotransferase family protein [Fictibacillus sp. UD]|uniref:aminoglycoside phosphotransferase family protein n=1 Tax=Fictibacillus sp. UD TaxID=3038777 RepID=UPI00374553DB
MNGILPETFIKTITGIHGDKASEWLENFEQLIANCEKRYHLHIQEPFNLSYNFVAPAVRKDGKEVVVKIVLSIHQFETELKALQLMASKSAVKVLEYEAEHGIMILERLYPGHTLAEVDDDEEAAQIAANVMKELIVLAPLHSNLPTVVDRENSLKRIYRNHINGYGPIPKETIEEALHIFGRLNDSIKKQYLLHGDLHHYNILKNGESWVAIDPKGLIGDREYEVVQYLLNKLPENNVEEITEKRIDIFVEKLNLDKERVLLRAYSHAVLATCWTVEDGNYSENFFRTIQMFKNLCDTNNLRGTFKNWLS